MPILKKLPDGEEVEITISHHALERFIQRRIKNLDIQMQCAINKKITLSEEEFQKMRRLAYKTLTETKYYKKNVARQKNINFISEDSSIVFRCIRMDHGKEFNPDGLRAFLVITILDGRMSAVAATKMHSKNSNVFVLVGNGIEVPMCDYINNTFRRGRNK